jgi:competence protein ComEC
MIGVGVYDAAFYFAAFFISGIFLASLGVGALFASLISFLSLSLFCLSGYLEIFKKIPPAKNFWLAGLSLSVILGFLYFSFYSVRRESGASAVFGKKINFQAVVSGYPKRGSYQDLVLSLSSPYKGKISGRFPLYPEFNYGDALDLEGTIQEVPSGGYGEYLEKEGIIGTIGFPKAEVNAENKGSFAKAVLYSIKKRIVRSFEKNLPVEESNLLAGLTLGEDSGFGAEAKEKMKNSGTTHLVALSGYNISILALGAMALFCRFLKRGHSFFAVIAVIIAFTLMAGAEASVVRAAIMGGILLLAEEAGRIYSMRNAIAAAAFFMVLSNPAVLRFDAGFQLSFAALLGMVYLAPAMKSFFKAKIEPGILEWRENFWATFSAQAAVFPILILKFGSFSVFSLASNVLILGFIPLTMALGFLTGFLDIVFFGVPPLLFLPVHMLLHYEISIIGLFGKFRGFSFSPSPVVFFFAYYAFLTGFILWINKKNAVKSVNAVS